MASQPPSGAPPGQPINQPPGQPVWAQNQPPSSPPAPPPTYPQQGPTTAQRAPRSREATIAAHGLGPLEATYKMHLGTTILHWFNATIGALGTILALLVLLGGSASSRSAGLLFLIIALAYLIPSIVALRSRLAKRILICADGLVVINGKKTDRYRWESVESFYESVVRTKYYVNGIPGRSRTAYAYTLRSRDGVATIGKDLGKAEALGDHLRRKIGAVLLPRLVAAYNAGETLDFGTLTMDKAGLSIGTQPPVRWGVVGGIRVRNGTIEVAVSRDGQDHYVSAALYSLTPNAFLFLALVNLIVTAR